jgi:cyclic-di-GMP-binding protein
MSLSLNLPILEPNLAASVEANPKRLREWLIALPLANPLVAGRQMCDALAACNRVKMSADNRVKLLDEYCNTLEHLQGELEVFYKVPGLPLKEQAHTAALLVRRLCLELADGYKIALTDRVEKRLSFGNAKVVPVLIQKILAQYYCLSQLCYRVYSPMPEGIWLEVHKLFRYAVEVQLIDQASADKNIPSVARTYKYILLLALAEPQRFAGIELDKVVEIVENYAGYAHFQPVSQLGSSAGFFLVSLDEDKPPQYVGARSMEGYLGGGVLLDTSELVRQLHKSLVALESKAPMANDRIKVLTWIEILRRVSRQWTIAAKRTFQRIASETPVDICLGLRAAVLCVNEGHSVLQPENFLDDKAVEVVIEELPITHWKVVNESPGGYAVAAENIQVERVRAGEIVALRAQGSENWMVASVRWLQQMDKQRLEIGLQIITVRAAAVMFRPTIGVKGEQYQPALLLPEIPALKQAPMLAAPKGSYMNLRELSVLTADGEILIRAAKLVEQQMGYDLFEYQLGDVVGQGYGAK